TFRTSRAHPGIPTAALSGAGSAKLTLRSSATTPPGTSSAPAPGICIAFLFSPGNVAAPARGLPVRPRAGLGSATNQIGPCLLPRPGLELWFIIAVCLLHEQDMCDE